MERQKIAVSDSTVDDRSMRILELLVSLSALATVVVLMVVR
ncbi:MAG TPA: hypothetical protein VGQ47_04065 [Candidatus Limnocylindrales bacterium]|jgi:hypothetical protein|nr:hypothetical protein [Candidatus Limnocylindrales bacterium]